MGEAASPAVISNERDLAIVHEQIGRLRRALESLRRGIGPAGERQFRLYAEGYVDLIEELTAAAEQYGVGRGRGGVQ